MRDIQKLLLVLKHHKGKVAGRTRFQKMIFLLKNKYKIKFGYDFIPYYYGPYSQSLQFEINMLSTIDAVAVTSRNRTRYLHTLTEKGHKLADRAEEEMTPSKRKALVIAVEKLRKKSSPRLISEAKKLAKHLLE